MGKGHRQAILKRRKFKWPTNPGKTASPTSNQETHISIRHVSSISSAEAYNYSSAAAGKHVCRPHSLSAPFFSSSGKCSPPARNSPPPSAEIWEDVELPCSLSVTQGLQMARVGPLLPSSYTCFQSDPWSSCFSAC